jgi:hypothetical protein
MDSYILLWDSYIQDATRITTRGALYGMTAQLQGNQTPMTVTGMAQNISSCLRTGSMDLGGGPVFCFSNVNSSLIEKLNNFTALAFQQLNINTTYQLDSDITVSDWAPFELLVSFTVNYTVSDADQPVFAKWNRSRRFDVIVSVDGLPDPLFGRYSNSGLMKAAYTQRNITKYAIPRDLISQPNISDLVAMRAFVEDRAVAPTYLERLAGIVNGSLDHTNSSGIESLVRPNETTIAAGIYMNVSFADHQVFAGKRFSCFDQTIRADGAPPFDTLYLDHEHWARYNQNASVLNYTCT